VVSLRDLEDAARVIAEFVRSVTPASDFRPGSWPSAEPRP
jgi:hypothetical protein